MEMVQCTALQVIFDLLHTFGLDAFQVETDTAEDEDEGTVYYYLNIKLTFECESPGYSFYVGNSYY